MKGKLKFIVPIAVLLVLGGAYKLVFSKPSAEGKEKVHGTVYPVPKEFVINLSNGRFAKVSVALVLDHAQPTAAEGGGEGAAEPPEGWGTLEQEAVVRAVVTDTLTDADGDKLISRKGREHLQHAMLKRLRASSDVKVKEVLFTDVTVQ